GRGPDVVEEVGRPVRVPPPEIATHACRRHRSDSIGGPLGFVGIRTGNPKARRTVTRPAHTDCTANLENHTDSVPFRLRGPTVGGQGSAPVVQVAQEGRVLAGHPVTYRVGTFRDSARGGSASRGWNGPFGSATRRRDGRRSIWLVK